MSSYDIGFLRRWDLGKSLLFGELLQIVLLCEVFLLYKNVYPLFRSLPGNIWPDLLLMPLAGRRSQLMIPSFLSEQFYEVSTLGTSKAVRWK